MKAAVRERAGRRLRGDELFDELSPGDWFKSPGRTISEADVVMFAGLTWDRNPAHTSETYARRGLFGERVAHGMLSLSYAIGLVPNETVAGLRRIQSVVFKSPVRFGDTIHVDGVVATKRPFSDELGLVTGRWKVLNQDATVVLKFEIDALWRRNALEGDDDD